MTFKSYIFWVLKAAAVMVVAWAFVGCGPKLDQTPVTAVAPTVRKPAPVKPVDLKPVVDRSRQVDESNRQLAQEIAKQKAIGYDLKRQLRIARVAAVVTTEQWDALEEKVEELQVSRDQLEQINGDQREALALMKEALSNSSVQVAVVQSSLLETQAALDDANLNIGALNTLNTTVTKERDAAVTAFSKSDGTITELEKSRAKWTIAFGVSTTLLIGAIYLIFKP